MAKFEINKSSLRKLIKNFDKDLDQKEKRFSRGLKNASLELVEEVRKNLVKNNRVDSRELYNSISATGVKNSNGVLKSSIFSASDYALVSEFGRKKGKAPPMNTLVGWAVRKGITPSLGATDTYEKIKQTGSKQQKKEMGIIFAISRKIARVGYEGKRSFRDVLDDVSDIVIKEMIRSFK